MNLDGFFAESLSCDPAHAQFSFPASLTNTE